MKKKIILISSLLGIILISGIIISNFRNGKTLIYVSTWQDRNEKFVLCNIEVEVCSDDHSSFAPVDEESFIKECQNHDGYIGKGDFNFLAVKNYGCMTFYYNDGLYYLGHDEGSPFFNIGVCCSIYMDHDSQWYSFPALTDWVPDKYDESKNNSTYIGTFTQAFGTYEKAVQDFYGYFSENVVTLDEENQVISVRLHNVYSNCMVDEKHVEIDFKAMEVREVMGSI